MNLRAMVVVLALAGCGASPNVLSYPGTIQPRTVIWMMTPFVCAEAKARYVRFEKEAPCERLAGFQYEDSKGFCYVVTRPPTSDDDAVMRRVVRHELGHCQDGSWHD